jgi:hypothetical protein
MENLLVSSKNEILQKGIFNWSSEKPEILIKPKEKTSILCIQDFYSENINILRKNTTR